MHYGKGINGRNTVYICAALMTLLLLGLLFFYYMKVDRVRTLRASLELTQGDPLAFSKDSGFFEEGFVLALNADECIPQDETIEIRYTIDGDDPTQDSLLYTDGIDLGKVIDQIEEAEAAQTEAAAEASSLDVYSVEGQRRQWEEEKDSAVSDSGLSVEKAEDGIYVIPVRARLVQGEDMSDIVTRTYVIGPGVFERYDAYVACVSIDSYDLFDYDEGIMIKGSHYQEDLDEGKREDRSGNYYQDGDEWTRDGHVTLFSPEGEVILEEDAGIKVGGYSSRCLQAKTLSLEASTERGSTDNYFQLDIFKSGSYSRIGSLETLENAGVDGSDPLRFTAASSTAFPTASGTGTGGNELDTFRRVRLRTHGVPLFRIRSVRNKYAKILTDASGLYGMTDARLGVTYLNGDFYTLCDISPSMTNEYMCSVFGLSSPDAIEKYRSSDYYIYTKAKILPLLNADLTLPENQKALEEAVDMDNYLFYFAAEVLFNNCDWPFNNVFMWRYIGEADPDNPYTDGRYRFIPEDMDQILTNGLHSMPDQWSTELLDYLMRDEGNTFYHVMQCKRYRDTFLTYVDDLLQTTFSPEYACPILKALYADMEREYINDYGEAFWQEMEDAAAITVENVREKESLYREDVTKYLGLEDRYGVRIEAGEGVSVTWNNMLVSPGDVWSGEYYRGTSFTVTARPAEGYRFVGWEINGMTADSCTSQTLEVSDSLSDSEVSVPASEGSTRDGSSEESALNHDSGKGDSDGETDENAQVTIRAITEPE